MSKQPTEDLSNNDKLIVQFALLHLRDDLKDGDTQMFLEGYVAARGTAQDVERVDIERLIEMFDVGKDEAS